MMSTEKKVPDPYQLFMQARGFARVGELVAPHKFDFEKMTGEIEITFASMPIWAFAVEMLLKCMIVLEQKSHPPARHELDLLYAQLPKGVRQRINKEWERRCRDEAPLALYLKAHAEMIAHAGGSTGGMSFEDILRDNSTAFQDWRYYYEAGNKDYYGLELCFYHLVSFVLHANPDWARPARPMVTFVKELQGPHGESGPTAP